MENDPKEEVTQKRLIEEAKRNLLEVARAVSEEEAAAAGMDNAATKEGEDDPSAEEFASMEAGAGASVGPPSILSKGRTTGATTKIRAESQASADPSRSVSSSSNRRLETSEFSIKTTNSLKIQDEDSHPAPVTGVGNLAVGSIRIDKTSDQISHSAVQDHGPASQGQTPEETEMEDYPKVILPGKNAPKEMRWNLEEIEMAFDNEDLEGDAADDTTGNLAAMDDDGIEGAAVSSIRAEASIIEVDRATKVTAPIITEVDVSEMDILAAVTTEAQLADNPPDDEVVLVTEEVPQSVLANILEAELSKIEAVAIEDEVEHGAIKAVGSETKAADEILGTDLTKVDTAEVTPKTIVSPELSGAVKLKDDSKVTSRSISDSSNRRFDTSEFSLKTTDSLKGQDDEGPDTVLLAVGQIRILTVPEDGQNVDTLPGQQISNANVEDQGARSLCPATEVEDTRNVSGINMNTQSTGPLSSTQPVYREDSVAPSFPQTNNTNFSQERGTSHLLASSTIADLIGEDTSEEDTGAVAAIVEVTADNLSSMAPDTRRSPTRDSLPPPYEPRVIPPTKKKSFLKRLFSKKARSSLRAERTNSPQRRA